MLSKGDRAPDFSLQDAQGTTRTLADFAGKTLVLYFYPKDDTPGCTKEACSFRDAFAEYRKRGIEVVGVSPDKPSAHAKFAEKYGLGFTLLADPDRVALQAYGAYGEKTMYGKKVMGVIRSTFVIDGTGTIMRVDPKVSPEGHAAQILADLEG